MGIDESNKLLQDIVDDFIKKLGSNYSYRCDNLTCFVYLIKNPLFFIYFQYKHSNNTLLVELIKDGKISSNINLYNFHIVKQCYEDNYFNKIIERLKKEKTPDIDLFLRSYKIEKINKNLNKQDKYNLYD